MRDAEAWDARREPRFSPSHPEGTSALQIPFEIRERASEARFDESLWIAVRAKAPSPRDRRRDHREHRISSFSTE